MKQYISAFVKYVPWAIVQHGLVFGVYALFARDPYSPQVLLAYAVTFTMLHVPNPELVLATAILSSFAMVLLTYVNPVVAWPIIIVIHAGGGAFLKVSGVEMRVLWKYPHNK